MLSTHGPLGFDEILEEAAAAGFDLGPDPADTLADALNSDAAPMAPIADGRWVWLPVLLNGRVFTHRLSLTEVEYDIVAFGTDLAALKGTGLAHLADGTAISEVSLLLRPDDVVGHDRTLPVSCDGVDQVLVFEAGHFARMSAHIGDLIAFRITDSGLECSPVTTTLDGGAGDAIGELLDALGQPMTLSVAVWTVCADRPGLFSSPSVPLGEALAAGELDVHGDSVAPSGFDFDEWMLQEDLSDIEDRYAISNGQALALLTLTQLAAAVSEMVDTVLDPEENHALLAAGSILAQLPQDMDRQAMATITARGLPPAAITAVLGELVDPAVVAAMLAETVLDGPREAATLAVFARTLDPLAPPAARGGLRWLLGQAYEALGDIELAERTYWEAESFDRHSPLILMTLARFSSDRGDAETSLALLLRAGMPRDAALVQLLTSVQPVPRAGLGRNQSCWCGSGRKYKVCHLRHERLPLDQRAGWLYQKAAWNLLEGDTGPLLLEVAEARAAGVNLKAGADMSGDPLVVDTVLLEGGGFEDFLAARGQLLPDDEHMLVTQWMLSERSVHEVVSVDPGRGMTLRDVRTGDLTDVQERSGSAAVRVGQMYCTRVGATSAAPHIFGGLEPVSAGEIDDLLGLLDNDPHPGDIVAFLSRPVGPPLVRNTEGEDLSLCEALLRTDDADRLGHALDTAYGDSSPQPNGSQVWSEYVLTDGLERIRATMELTGDRLRITANSEARFDRALTRVRALDASLTVLSETRQPISNAEDLRRVSEQGASESSSQLLTPADQHSAAAAVAGVIAKYEASWLDQSIPALDGRTPRECAEDPTRRPDVIRLLDSLPAGSPDGTTMSPDRLRAALGLN